MRPSQFAADPQTCGEELLGGPAEREERDRSHADADERERDE
jgi:hypothetical protein